jgi:C1A family cysteine protease
MLPPRVDYRQFLPPVRDQGTRSTCVAFALTCAHEWGRLIQNGESLMENLSEEVLYWASKKIDGDIDPGTSLASASIALRDTGQPRAQLWMYDGARDETAAYEPPAEAIEPSHCFRHGARHASNTSEALKALLTDRILSAVVLPVGYHFFMPQDGFIPTPSAGEPVGDLHAVTLVGYDDDVEQGVFIIRNSWGSQWGHEGYGFLPYQYIDLHAVGAWCLSDDP